MKRILIRGTAIVFSVGVLAFIVYYVLDFLIKLWKPMIMAMFDREYLVTPLTIVFTILLVILVGFLFTHKRVVNRLRKFPVINWLSGEGKKIPQTIHDMPGALVKFSEGSYYIAALVGHQKFTDKDGETEVMYKLYCPSAPVPWSGLPIIFAKKEQVIPLKISFGEVYGITTSFGRSAPEILEELSLEDADATVGSSES
ncbi:MAG TPA: hypothetical protein G4O13_03775 [Dehalococcoidia bacterium]|nr:hypothetical protein [Dehalococcoidia bacterium]